MSALLLSPVSSVFSSSPEFKTPEKQAASSVDLALPAALPNLSNSSQAWFLLHTVLKPEPVHLELPEDYCCPITSSLMRDPVSTADGQTYEREAIEKWLQAHNTSPLGGAEPLETKKLTSSVFAKKAISRLIEEKPILKDSKEWYLPQAWVTALARACAEGNVASIQTLVSQDRRLLVHTFSGESEYQGKTALQLAATGDSKALDAVIALLEKRQTGLGLAALLQVNALGRLPLHQAILAGQDAETLLKLMAWMGETLESVQAPANWSVELDKRALNEALFWSLAQQDLSKMACLLRLGASSNAKNDKGQSLLYLAVQDNFHKGLQLLLKAKADPNLIDERLSDTPLHCAIRKNHLDVLLLLKSSGVKLDQKLKDETTGLHLIAEKEAVQIAEALWPEEKSITPTDLGARDKKGNTALHRAAITGSTEMLTWLLEKGADREAANAQGQTAFHLAAEHNQVAVMDRLLKKQALIHAKDEYSNTPLHLAAQAGRSEAVVFLLEAGLPAAKNQFGQTPRQLGELHCHQKMLEKYDKTMSAMKAKEEALIKGQGVLGVFLLKQQRLIEQQATRIEDLEKQLAVKTEEHGQLIERLKEQLINKTKIDSQQFAQLNARIEPLVVEARMKETKQARKAEQERIRRSWQSSLDPKTHKLFYRNSVTHEQVWTAPESYVLEGAALEMQQEADRQAAYTWEQQRKEAAERAQAEDRKELKKLPEFLRCIAYGEQDKAEAMLKKRPNLALRKGDLQDPSGREFKEITGFQYTVWGLDWHMWKMLLKYIPKEAAAMQFQELEGKGTAYGKRFSLTPLIEALNTYVKNYDGLNGTYWCRQVGGCQLLLPISVVNEYCHPSRSFVPVPGFEEEGLKRSHQTDYGPWWETKREYNRKLGESLGYCRYNSPQAAGRESYGRHLIGIRDWVGGDIEALQSLSKKREAQLQALRVNLSSIRRPPGPPAFSPGLGGLF